MRYVPIAAFATLALPDIYLVTYSTTNTIMRYSDSGEFQEVFVPKGIGNMNGAQSLAFGGPDGELFVADGVAHQLIVFDPLTGQYKRSIGTGFGQLYGIAFDPAGIVYTSDAFSPLVHKLNPVTGQYFGPFTIGGNLSNARAILFGPNNNLYVGSQASGSVKQFNGVTGNYIGESAVGISGPDGFDFLPNGNLAVVSELSKRVTEHNPVSGQQIRILIPEGEGGMIGPRHVLRMHDDNLLVSDTAGNAMLKFDSATGGFIGTFASGGPLTGPVGAAYGPTLTLVPLESMVVQPGNILEGGLPHLMTSDDSRLLLRPGVVLSTSIPPIRLTVEATVPKNVSRVRCDVESAASSTSIRERVEFYNFTTGLYDLAGQHQMTTSDKQYRFAMESGANYIEPGTRRVRARVSCWAVGPVLAFPWLARFDQIRFVTVE